MKETLDNHARTRTSDLLQSLIRRAKGDGEISIAEIMHMLGERAFGLAILVFCLPNSLPLPGIPGFSSITGIPIILFAAQMGLGRHAPWLPARIAAYRFSREKFAAFLEKTLPYIERIEKLLHPRLVFMQTRVAEIITSLAFIFLALVLALPIPFGNFPPGLAMCLIALGLLERDGVMMLIGIIGGISAVILIYATLGAAAFDAAQKLFDIF